MDNKREFKILAIDGGGVRGIIPAVFLAKCEAQLKEPIWSYFDLICGTSSGGIAALALAAGRRASDLLLFYKNSSKEIFPAGGLKKLRGYARRFFGDGGFYDAAVLERILKSVFREGGNDLRMKDAKTRLCIPAVDITNDNAVVFKTPHKLADMPQRLSADDDLEMWKVAMATAAAPAYFRAAEVRSARMVDGGIMASNPALVGALEAVRSGFAPDEIKLLSLGTGSSTFAVKQSRARRMNLIFGWKFGVGLLDLLFDIQAEAVHRNVGFLLKKDNYVRVQRAFMENIPLDDVSRLKDLDGAGEALYREKCAEVFDKFFRQKGIAA